MVTSVPAGADGPREATGYREALRGEWAPATAIEDGRGGNQRPAQATAIDTDGHTLDRVRATHVERSEDHDEADGRGVSCEYHSDFERRFRRAVYNR